MNPSPNSSHKTWTLVAVCLGTFMLLLDITIVVVALPSIRGALHTSFSEVQWTVDAYALSLAALLLPAGSIGDILGRRRVFALGLVIFTAASLLCGVATSGPMLIIARAIQGIGGATIFATSLALLAQTFHGRERGFAFGVWGAVTGVSAALGPLLGGALTSGLSWRWIFYVNLPVGIVATVITLTRVAEFRPPNPRRIDILGFTVFTAALVTLVYGLIESGTRGWGDGLVDGCLASGALLLLAFPILEARREQPMLDPKLFRKPTFVGASLAALAMNGSLFAMFLFLTIYLQTGLHLSPLGTGLRLAIVTAGSLVTAIPAGPLSQRISARWLIGPGLLLVGAGLLLMRGLDGNSSWKHLILGFIVAGLGMGLVNPPLASAAIGVVQPQDAGMASGINSTFRQVGIATSVAALGTVFSSHLNGADALTLPAHYASAMNALLLITAAIALAGGGLSLLLIRRKDAPHGAPPSDEHPDARTLELTA